MTAERIAPDPEVVKRHNELFDLYSQWPGEPDDDLEFVDQAREIMGLAPLDDKTAARSADEYDDPGEGEEVSPEALEAIVRAHVPDEDLDEILRYAAEELTDADYDELYEAMRAAGHDITPGHDELHHYWTRDPRGLRKWVKSLHPWRTLYSHIVKFVGPLKAKLFTSRWYIEVFGYSAGSDKARVAHGKPPRGHRIGPG